MAPHGLSFLIVETFEVILDDHVIFCDYSNFFRIFFLQFAYIVFEISRLVLLEPFMRGMKFLPCHFMRFGTLVKCIFTSIARALLFLHFGSFFFVTTTSRPKILLMRSPLFPVLFIPSPTKMAFNSLFLTL